MLVLRLGGSCFGRWQSERGLLVEGVGGRAAAGRPGPRRGRCSACRGARRGRRTPVLTGARAGMGHGVDSDPASCGTNLLGWPENSGSSFLKWKVNVSCFSSSVFNCNKLSRPWGDSLSGGAKACWWSAWGDRGLLEPPTDWAPLVFTLLFHGIRPHSRSPACHMGGLTVTSE